MSSCSKSATSFFSAYHLDSQSRMIPIRCPTGFTFCPIKSLLTLSQPQLSICDWFFLRFGMLYLVHVVAFFLVFFLHQHKFLLQINYLGLVDNYVQRSQLLI